MIKLAPDATFDAVVRIEDNGKNQPAEARFIFRALDSAAYVQLLIVMGFGKFSAARRWWARVVLCVRKRRLVNLADVLSDVIVDWDGFDLPYSRDALERLLLTFPGVGWSILRVYMEERQGARIKN